MTDTEARKLKLDTRTAAIKKARARLRQSQRKERSKRLENLGDMVEASIGKKLTQVEEEHLAQLLAFAATVPLSMVEILGALLAVRDKVVTPETEAQTRASLCAIAKRHLETPKEIAPSQ